MSGLVSQVQISFPSLQTRINQKLVINICLVPSLSASISRMKRGFWSWAWCRVFSLGSEQHNLFKSVGLQSSFYLKRDGRKCVCVFMFVCVCVSVCHCHAKDKRACPVPSGAKPAGCHSGFCFVLCSVFNPRHTLLWRAFSPFLVLLCVCVCVCACVYLS